MQSMNHLSKFVGRTIPNRFLGEGVDSVDNKNSDEYMKHGT